MNKLINSLCTVAVSIVLAAICSAENNERSELWEIFPGECYLDGLISPPHKSISDMEGFEVPLVAVWSPIRMRETASAGTQGAEWRKIFKEPNDN